MLPCRRSTERPSLTRRHVYSRFTNTFAYCSAAQVLDATLKEITAALLESDVNVKLVASLRQKVKGKVKATLDGSEKSKDSSRKNLIQKVRIPVEYYTGVYAACHPGCLR
jgi:signal recognition particle GTPase